LQRIVDAGALSSRDPYKNEADMTGSLTLAEYEAKYGTHESVYVEDVLELLAATSTAPD
jgi:hypothetical protein